MIVVEKVMIDGREFNLTYSDDDRLVVRDGVAYDEALDPAEYGRTYTEGDKKDPDATAEEILGILLGEEEQA